MLFWGEGDGYDEKQKTAETRELGLENQKVTKEGGRPPAGGDPCLLPGLMRYLAAANTWRRSRTIWSCRCSFKQAKLFFQAFRRFPSSPASSGLLPHGEKGQVVVFSFPLNGWCTHHCVRRGIHSIVLGVFLVQRLAGYTVAQSSGHSFVYF